MTMFSSGFSMTSIISSDKGRRGFTGAVLKILEDVLNIARNEAVGIEAKYYFFTINDVVAFGYFN